MKSLSSNKTVRFFFLLHILLLSHWVFAFKSLYIGGLGGVLLTKNLAISKSNLSSTLPPDVAISYKPGYKFGLFAGLKFAFVRAELEVSRLRSEANDIIIQGKSVPLGGNITTQLVMANGLLFLPGIVDIYGGAGVGYVSVDNSLSNTVYSVKKSLDNKNVGYQVIFGLSLKLGLFTVFTDYRYVGTGHVDALNKAYANHTANAGLYVEIA